MKHTITQDDVLERFRLEAETLGELQSTQSDIILKFAKLLANEKKHLSRENFEEFVHIGAVMYQEALGKYRARTELSETMVQSLRET